ncbi:hypothetical protein FKM82_030497 [Ascaphus truei]
MGPLCLCGPRATAQRAHAVRQHCLYLVPGQIVEGLGAVTKGIKWEGWGVANKVIGSTHYRNSGKLAYIFIQQGRGALRREVGSQLPLSVTSLLNFPFLVVPGMRAPWSCN